jgi:hypothetical protein
MEHAATYYIGHHPATRQTKTNKIASASRSIHPLDATVKRCSRNRQEQNEVRTCADATNGFLKTTFLPKLEQLVTIQDTTEIKKIEDDFYRSLCGVANYYAGFEPTDTSTLGYPYNMALSVWETENHLKRKVKDWDSLRLVQDNNGKTFFITEHRYSTGTNLYYIPVIPLYQKLKNKSTKKTACLLLSVCAYLYHVADVPYYRQEYTYLYSEYEMIKDWIEQDEEAEEDSRLNELQVAEWIGDRMEQKIFNRKNLEVFAGRINAFRPATDYERECLQLARQALTLYTDYPHTNLFEHRKDIQYDDEQEDEVIRMDSYISFIANTKGWLFENLADCINNEFNEYSEMEEPVIQKQFDGKSKLAGNLDFENRLFSLIDELCYLLCND